MYMKFVHACPLFRGIDLLSYYYFRFIGCHCYFQLSANIGDGTVETTVSENRAGEGWRVPLKFRSYLVRE